MLNYEMLIIFFLWNKIQQTTIRQKGRKSAQQCGIDERRSYGQPELYDAYEERGCEQTELWQWWDLALVKLKSVATMKLGSGHAEICGNDEIRDSGKA